MGFIKLFTEWQDNHVMAIDVRLALQLTVKNMLPPTQKWCIFVLRKIKFWEKAMLLTWLWGKSS
jgi:hypothetical protein